jgi:glycosyltransferase involved in cell wall biosynthesis
MTRGIPVVASCVGGVPELVEDGVNGYYVTPFDDANAYCKALRALQSDRAKLARLAAAGKQTVDERHSWAAFQQTLRSVPGYLTPSTVQSASTPPKPARQAA